MTGSDKKSEKKIFIVPMLPLREVIIFPHMVVPLFVGREKSIEALEAAIQNKLSLFLCAQKDASVVNPKQEDIYSMGTLGTIVQLVKLPDNTVKILIEGKKRAIGRKIIPNDKFMQMEVEELEEPKVNPVRLEALLRSIKTVFENYVKFNKRIPPEVVMNISSINEPSRLGDIIVAHLTLRPEEKQKVLELLDPAKRLEKILALMQGEIEILQVERKIRSRVKKQMEKNQKEYYLNEQINAIQKELGDKDEFKVELNEIEEKIETAELSQEAREKVEKEFRKFKTMSPMSAEATVVRNYIDWILSLPWGKHSKDNWDLKKAEKSLKNDHYGLDDVRERILEFLAVRTLTQNAKGSILCFAGPPGVGKTSLAKSIAAAVNKKFVRASLGGVRDEAEIRGHRRTYVGALPGKILQSLKKAGTSNPVFLLDEIDKMSSDFRGDPSSALLEVLDPEQNSTFMDHYLEVEFDLSKILFILTANSLHTIPRPLLDRMEVITLPGYTLNEKTHIAKDYLVPRQIKAHGLREDKFKIPVQVIRQLIQQYTREAGVRNLEREISNLCRKTAYQIVRGASDALKNKRLDPRNLINNALKKIIIVQAKALKKILGPAKYTISKTEEKSEVGLVNGLAWTEAGGDMLQVEVAVLPGKGSLKITGKLGDVMQESAQAAMSYVRARSALLDLEEKFFEKVDIHVHVPEGAVPKDGPSAGITIATALTSALIKVPAKKNVAMTGEITLRGRVLPIGGLKEKLIAAKVGGATTIIFPKENEKDLDQVSQEIKKGLTLYPVISTDEVLRLALDIRDASNFMRKNKTGTKKSRSRNPLKNKEKNKSGSITSIAQ